MRAIPHHPLRFALLALLVLQFGAVASAQTLAELDEARATVDRLAAALEPAGLAVVGCGNGYGTSIIACAYDEERVLSNAEIRAAVEAAIVAVGFDLGTVTWVQNPEYPENPTAKWSVPTGEYTMGVSAWSEIWFHPADECAPWSETDPFDFAANSVGGTWTMQATPRVAECVGFDHEDEFGQTPLIYAINAANDFSFEQVLRYSDPNHRTLAGWTPLMYAARLDNPWAGFAIAKLLEAGADKSVRTPDGTSAAFLAAGNPSLSPSTRSSLLAAAPVPADGPAGREAFLDACERLVAGQLVSPASARYAPVHEAELPTIFPLDRDGYLYVAGTGHLWVSGVDSLNSLGVTVREYVACIQRPGQPVEAEVRGLEALRQILPAPDAPLVQTPTVDPESRRVAEAYVRQNDELRSAYSQYQREIACGLLPDRPTECFVVTRTRPMVAMVNGALVSDAVIVVTVTFHEGLELIDRYGAERGLELINAEPAGRQCEKRFQAAPDVSVDWTVSPDGIINLHATYGGLQPHGDDHTPPDPFHELSALCE